MLVFPNCKINLGLQILQKREDGYHDLDTVFYPVQLHDALELIPNRQSANEIEYSESGFTVDGKVSNNLCVQAYQLLKKDFPEIPPVKIHLHKAIPIGAGLGGGSADAAGMLNLLNEQCKLRLTTDQLLRYALLLGSDCPFFIINKPCFATGRGEKLDILNISLSAYTIVLINPAIHINTGWAFSTIIPEKNRKSVKEIITQPIQSWKNELINDFELPVFKAYPAIEAIKTSLYEYGAHYASLSGSGSTVYGIFDKNINLDSLKVSDYFMKVIN